MKFNEKKPFDVLIYSVVILPIYFIVRLVDQSKIIKYFPFEMTNDVSSYMAMLHFFSEYGFHGFVSHWYNGFVLFSSYPPGVFFFMWPLLKLLGDVKLTFFISLVILYFLGFVLIYFFGKIHKFSLLKTLSFYVFLFFNPISISHFVRMLRIPALFAFIILLALFLLLFYYQNKKCDFLFYSLFSFLYALLIISHQAEFILFNFFLLGFFLLKTWKERILIILSSLCGILFSSFWLFPFIKSVSKLQVLNNYSGNLLDFTFKSFSAQISNFIVPLFLVTFFFFFIKTSRNLKKDFLLFLPLVLLAVLHFFRLTLFIPGIKYIYSGPYLTFFSFFIFYFFLSIDFESLSFFYKKFIAFCLFLLPFIFIFLSLIFTSWFNIPTEVDGDIIDVMSKVDGRYVMLGDFPLSSYPKAFYSYGSIYFNLSTSHGWAHQYATPSYLNKLENVTFGFEDRDCIYLRSALQMVSTTNLISIAEGCEFLFSCGLSEVSKSRAVCLYRI